MQGQQQQQPNLRQKLQGAIQLARVIYRATRQDSTALQIGDMLVKSLEQLNVSPQSVQMFKDRLEKVRQSRHHAQLEDIYIMGGILIYCGVLLPVLISLGIPDLPARVAWIAFAISLPCTIGFFLIRFLEKKNSISSGGVIHRSLASLAEIGVIATTTGLFFHVWNIAGWVFLLCVLVVFLGYSSHWFGIYFKPFLGILRDILKNLNNTPPST